VTTETDARLEQHSVDVIRGLAMDGVQQASSGHPGTPMALAPLAHVLFTRIMRYDASDPEWPDRDRFVLSAATRRCCFTPSSTSAGSGSSSTTCAAFRQWGSATPGHPERGHTAGVEVTTGPLGQGISNAVGLAVAEANLRARFGPSLTDHHVFAVCSDGDLMEASATRRRRWRATSASGG